MNDDSRASMGRFLSQPPARKGDFTRAKQLSPFDAAVADATTRAATGEWDDAKATSLLGLYVLCHTRIYGVEPAELRAEFGIALKRVRSLLVSEFDTDPDRFAGFIRWTWLREQRKRERVGNQNGFRIGWRLQFSANMLTDWRVATRSVR